MTTIINLNILNFFRLSHNKYTTNDNRLNVHYHNKRTDRPAGEDVIDITPQSRDVTAEAPAGYRRSELPAVRFSQPAAAPASRAVDSTYDRMGKTVRYFKEKGTKVNSFA